VVLLALARYADAPALLRSGLAGLGALGPWGPPIFVLMYVLATVLFLPGWILTLGAGAVFGVAKGSVLVSIAATSGATAAFLVGRYVARSWVASRTAGDPRFRALDEAVGRDGPIRRSPTSGCPEEADQRGIAITTFVQELEDVDRAVLDGETEGFSAAAATGSWAPPWWRVTPARCSPS
jgi:hypothetical protein